MQNTNKTPIPSKLEEKETSAYRSYQRRENQRLISSESNTEALEKFSTVVQMLNANKVTKSNAFENRMIDYIADIFTNLGASNSGSESVWQKYSTGVDSCAKIYGFCVDFIHSETYKVLGGLNRTGNQEVENENQDEDPTKPKKKKKILGGIATLEKDIQSITTTKFEKYEQFDPYFKVVSSKFDAATSSGLLLNNLTLNGALDIVLIEDDRLHKTAEADLKPKITISGLNFNEAEICNLELCKELLKYSEESDPINFETALEKIETKGDVFIVNESEESTVDDDTEDDLFGLQDMMSSAKKKDSESLITIAIPLQERINELNDQDDYSFFKNSKNSSWVGFENWKKTQISTNPSEKQQRKKKEYEDLSLSDDLEASESQVFAKPKKGYPSYYPESILNKWSESLAKIPKDYGFSITRLTQLYTRQRTKVKYLIEGREMKNVVVEKDLETSNEENILFAEEIDDYVPAANEDNFKVTITSKTVDIKKLKETMWAELNKKNSKNPVLNTEKNSFLSIVGALPSSMSSNEVENLSIHSCFITILHLANEHNLKLEQTAPCDFKIYEKLS